MLHWVLFSDVKFLNVNWIENVKLMFPEMLYILHFKYINWLWVPIFEDMWFLKFHVNMTMLSWLVTSKVLRSSINLNLCSKMTKFSFDCDRFSKIATVAPWGPALFNFLLAEYKPLHFAVICLLSLKIVIQHWDQRGSYYIIFGSAHT